MRNGRLVRRESLQHCDSATLGDKLCFGSDRQFCNNWGLPGAAARKIHAARFGWLRHPEAPQERHLNNFMEMDLTWQDQQKRGYRGRGNAEVWQSGQPLGTSFYA